RTRRAAHPGRAPAPRPGRRRADRRPPPRGGGPAARIGTRRPPGAGRRPPADAVGGDRPVRGRRTRAAGRPSRTRRQLPPLSAPPRLRRAHRSPTPDRPRPPPGPRLADAEWHLDPATAARHLTPLVAAAHAGHLDIATGLVLVRRLLWHGRDTEAVSVLDVLRT